MCSLCLFNPASQLPYINKLSWVELQVKDQFIGQSSWPQSASPSLYNWRLTVDGPARPERRPRLLLQGPATSKQLSIRRSLTTDDRRTLAAILRHGLTIINAVRIRRIVTRHLQMVLITPPPVWLLVSASLTSMTTSLDSVLRDVLCLCLNEYIQ